MFLRCLSPNLERQCPRSSPAGAPASLPICSSRVNATGAFWSARSVLENDPLSAPVSVPPALCLPLVFLTVVAHVVERGGGLEPPAAAGPAEAPELPGSALVAVDEVIELELDLAGVEQREAVPHVHEQDSQLLLVVVASDSAGRVDAAMISTRTGNRPSSGWS